jgi:hypothetical protein
MFTIEYYLVKGPEIAKCSDGYRALIGAAWVVKCQRLVQPYTVK